MDLHPRAGKKSTKRNDGVSFSWHIGSVSSFLIYYIYTHCCSSLSLSLKQSCTVDLPGGPLEIEWSEEDNHVYMTGPAEAVFYGSVPLWYSCRLTSRGLRLSLIYLPVFCRNEARVCYSSFLESWSGSALHLYCQAGNSWVNTVVVSRLQLGYLVGGVFSIFFSICVYHSLFVFNFVRFSLENYFWVKRTKVFILICTLFW